MAKLNELDALYAFLTAAAVTALLTPFTMRLARAVGAVDEPRERGLSDRATPLLGGLAIFAGVLVAVLAFLPAGYGSSDEMWHGVLIAATLITVVGALDDRFDLPPLVKLVGQIAAAVIVVHFGVAVKSITLPFAGTLHFPNAGPTNAGPALTVIGLVVMMNIVNLSDGVDGLAAGVCVIIAGTLAIIAFDLDRAAPGVLGRIDGRRRARFPDPQLPTRLELHGRLRGQPAGTADGGGGRRGSGQEASCRVLRVATDPADRTVLGHHFRGAQALEVQAPDLRGRQ